MNLLDTIFFLFSSLFFFPFMKSKETAIQYYLYSTCAKLFVIFRGRSHAYEGSINKINFNNYGVDVVNKIRRIYVYSILKGGTIDCLIVHSLHIVHIREWICTWSQLQNTNF